MNPGAIFDLLKDSYKEWAEDKASTWAAALAYYTIFSIGPLLLIVVSVAGFVYGQKAAEGQIVGQLQALVGAQAAEVTQGLLTAAAKPREGIIGTIVGLATLALGAAAFFGQLQTTLNAIWEVQPPSRGILATVVARGLTFLMVLALGVLLLALLAVSAAIAAIRSFFGSLLPGPAAGLLLQGTDLLISFAVITLVFAAIYRVLPDTTVNWKDVWIGAAFTAFLFAIGKVALGIYLGTVSVGSAFGAAGSLVVLLVWIYYSAQIFLFGAEFTQVYANKYGPNRVPQENASAEGGRDVVEHGGPPEARAKGPRAPSPIRAGMLQATLALGVVAAGLGALRGGRG